MSGQHRVLIVDPSEETREVLQTVLQRRGVATMSANRLQGGLALAEQNQPDLIVLDLECVDSEGKRLLLPLAERSNTPRPRLLLLGTFRRQRAPFPDGEFMSKPYDYGALVRKIEELIGESEPCRRCSSSAGPIKEPALN